MGTAAVKKNTEYLNWAKNPKLRAMAELEKLQATFGGCRVGCWLSRVRLMRLLVLQQSCQESPSVLLSCRIQCLSPGDPKELKLLLWALLCLTWSSASVWDAGGRGWSRLRVWGVWKANSRGWSRLGVWGGFCSICLWLPQAPWQCHNQLPEHRCDACCCSTSFLIKSYNHNDEVRLEVSLRTEKMLCIPFRYVSPFPQFSASSALKKCRRSYWIFFFQDLLEILGTSLLSQNLLESEVNLGSVSAWEVQQQ